MFIQLLKALWVLCSVAILGVTLYSYVSHTGSDIGVFLVYGMLFLAFPSSLLVAGLIALLVFIQERLGVSLLDLIESNRAGFCVMWLAFFTVGYWQWFKFVPWLWCKWKTRCMGGRDE